MLMSRLMLYHCINTSFFFFTYILHILVCVRKMSWAVVHFHDENCVEVVPETWTVGNTEVFWPSIKNRNKIFEAIRKRDSPGCDWGIFKIKKLGCYDDFKTAQSKCNKARECDNLSSSTEVDEPLGKGYRTTTVSKVFQDFTTDISEDSEECEQYPEIPKSLETRSSANCNKQAKNKEDEQILGTQSETVPKIFETVELENSKEF
uniref:Uncharacterized protein n=1 Tax=Photinus pyralis TaxID=7054 RepID=A0A1Y1L6K4_PHOPY